VESGQQVAGRKVLRGEHAVDCVEGKLTATVQEIGQMRLPEASLPGKQRDAKRTPLNPAQQLQAEFLVHLRKIHLWKFRHKKWVTRDHHFLEKTSKAE